MNEEVWCHALKDCWPTFTFHTFLSLEITYPRHNCLCFHPGTYNTLAWTELFCYRSAATMESIKLEKERKLFAKVVHKQGCNYILFNCFSTAMNLSNMFNMWCIDRLDHKKWIEVTWRCVGCLVDVDTYKGKVFDQWLAGHQHEVSRMMNRSYKSRMEAMWSYIVHDPWRKREKMQRYSSAIS